MLKPGQYTARSVLEFVVKVLEEEPKRLFMPSWVSWFKGEKKTGLFLGMKKLPKPSQLGECGTAACVAGWINIVTRDPNPMGMSDSWGALHKLGLRADGLGDMRVPLDRIFFQTMLPKRAVIRRLKAYIAEYGERLGQLPVEVSK